MHDFDQAIVRTPDTTIFTRSRGLGPPVLLLHGFPQTHLMWTEVARRMASDFTVICADLRGYGQSGCPASAPGHAPYAKRALALDMIAVMAHFGFSRFALAGHDRGGRVAYRLALDHPDRVTKLAVFDILPTDTVWERADERFALGYWPWSLLAQTEPLPERILAAIPDVIVDAALSGWGSPASAFSPAAREAYVAALRGADHVHAICEEYRAAATIDREHDRADRAAGRKINCPMLALWSAAGPLGTWYENDGGPLALWRQWADDVQGRGVDGGHFFPEEKPEETAAALRDFLTA